ncbi:hypothetical protein A3C37_00825 [Candidatus Peribacteria bacterium RIFCSPHIGHO2_02_FULL_53_20]|nr:MAG: hypothetical protein A3C37_00825 [Candidatus Peribacteria bacterium RIFCSPHIGHO2_02_FULL_53_20]
MLQIANCKYTLSAIFHPSSGSGQVLQFAPMRFDPEKVTIGVLTAILAILVLQTIRGPVNHGTPGDIAQEGDPCVGEPIVVGYAYDYQMLEPHACKIQCSDKKQRYIQYTNGLATQCDTPPGCNDIGEDRRVTCVVAGAVSEAENSSK